MENGCEVVRSLESIEAHEKDCIYSKCKTCNAMPIKIIEIEEKLHETDKNLQEQITKTEYWKKKFEKVRYSRQSLSVRFLSVRMMLTNSKTTQIQH